MLKDKLIELCVKYSLNIPFLISIMLLVFVMSMSILFNV